MKKIIFIFSILSILVFPAAAKGSYSPGERSGYILLQVEKNGEAWYVYPTTGTRYYLGKPADAFAIMRELSLGATHSFIFNTDIFPANLGGMILLDVNQSGEAYYIYPKDRKKYYLGRPADAFRIMSELGQGISNSGLLNIPVGEIITGAIIDSEIPLPQTGKILENVPFTSQVPFGDWSDSRQADGCEEASALMAVKWARGQSLTKDEALKEITGASDFILQKYGEYRDTSTFDTLSLIIRDYFGYQSAALKKNILLTDIIDELSKGNIVIAPMNGQILKNPYYAQPGPLRHMIVIVGYDSVKKVFITNDPGTEMGGLYEYDIDILFGAIRDYSTGFREPVHGIEKNVIVVWK